MNHTEIPRIIKPKRRYAH